MSTALVWQECPSHLSSALPRTLSLLGSSLYSPSTISNTLSRDTRAALSVFHICRHPSHLLRCEETGGLVKHQHMASWVAVEAAGNMKTVAVVLATLGTSNSTQRCTDPELGAAETMVMLEAGADGTQLSAIAHTTVGTDCDTQACTGTVSSGVVVLAVRYDPIAAVAVAACSRPAASRLRQQPHNQPLSSRRQRNARPASQSRQQCSVCSAASVR